MASMTNSNPLLEHVEDGKIYDLDFGDTWSSTNDSNSSKYAYHTIKYDFKPASVAKSDQAELTVGSNQDVSITLPNVEGSATQSTKFSGNTKSYSQKECLMIIDPRTGKIVLERLSANVRVKNVRTENRPANPPIKLPTSRPVTEPPSDKKPSKLATTTTAAAAATPTPTTATTTKPTLQKTTVNPSKPPVTAPVKPMPTKRPASPLDDRLSGDEFSPEPSDAPSMFSSQALPSSQPLSTSQTSTLVRRSSHASLERDLQLSETESEDENDDAIED